ncbi:MAG: hypothetical protein K6F09_09335 [Clostridiales bacterium]|nr:hypothetical protein [Clostridiales bacterium]
MERESLLDLSEKYVEGSYFIGELIDKNGDRLKAAVRNGDRNEMLRLTSLIAELGNHKRELLDTANKLRDYYKFSCETLKG